MLKNSIYETVTPKRVSINYAQTNLMKNEYVRCFHSQIMCNKTLHLQKIFLHKYSNQNNLSGKSDKSYNCSHETDVFFCIYWNAKYAILVFPLTRTLLLQ